MCWLDGGSVVGLMMFDLDYTCLARAAQSQSSQSFIVKCQMRIKARENDNQQKRIFVLCIVIDNGDMDSI